jgi:uncharacterized membrane protein
MRPIVASPVRQDARCAASVVPGAGYDRTIAEGTSTPASARAASVLPYALAAAAAIGYAAASIFRHQRFGSNAYDLGLYDQSLWGFSRFDVAIPHTIAGEDTLIGGHFQPLLFLLTPLYWIWADPRMLLAAQAVLLAAASLPLQLWARERLGTLPAAIFQVAFLVFWGVLAGNLFDFHAVALAAPIISAALYALLTERTRLLLLFVALGLLVRENLGLTFAALGVYAAVVQRRFRLGAAITVVSTAWFLVAMKAILPAISGRRYAHWYYDQLGSGPLAAVRTLLTDPIDSARIFFTPHVKRVALFNLFAAWLALPLVSPLLIVAIPSLAERFFADRPEFWAQGFHYSIVVAPILAFAAVDTTRRIVRRVEPGRAPIVAAAIAGAVLLAGLYFSFVRLRPLDELGRYTSAAHAADIRSCLETIPGDASVAATSALVPHLSRRPSIYLLDRRPIPPTEYVAIDVVTWMFPLTLGDVDRLVERLLESGYGIECTNRGTVVLRRGAPRGRLDPALERLLSGAER